MQPGAGQEAGAMGTAGLVRAMIVWTEAGAGAGAGAGPGLGPSLELELELVLVLELVLEGRACRRSRWRYAGRRRSG